MNAPFQFDRNGWWSLPSAKQSFDNHTAQINWLRHPLVLLVVQAFFVGLAFGLLENVAYTNLVISFGGSGLRNVYVLVGITVPIFTVLFNTLEYKIHLSRYSYVTLMIFTALFFGSYFLISTPFFRHAAYVLMVIHIMGSLHCMMLRGSHADEIFDARTIKRNYPKITGGEILAIVLAGLLVGPLSRIVGSLERLLLLGGGSMMLAFIAVQQLIRNHIAPIEKEHTRYKHEKYYGKKANPISGVLTCITKRYTLLVFSYQMIVSMILLLVQYLVYTEASMYFTTRAEMSQFIGLVKAAATALSFLFLTWAAGKMLIRFGMPLGLAISPVAVALLLLSAIVAGAFTRTSGAPFFAMIITSHIVYYVSYSGFAKTSIQSAFQPLAPKEREAVHAFAQGVGIPVSYGLTGLILIFFSRMSHFTAHYAIYPTLILTGVCAVVAVFLYRCYSDELRHSLSWHSISEMELNLKDASTLKIVEGLLASEDPSVLKIGLDLLENSCHSTYEMHLRRIAHGNYPESFRIHVLDRVERLKPAWGHDVAEKAFMLCGTEEGKSSAVRVLCACAEDPVSVAKPFLSHSSSLLRSAAVGSLFLYGGINGILQAGNEFNRMLSSRAASDRKLAAQILERTAITNFYHPVVQLLHDEDLHVVHAALKAAGSIRHPALIPAIEPWVDSPGARSEALSALIAFGGDMEPLLRRCLHRDPSIPSARAIRIIRACSHVADARIGMALEDSLCRQGDPLIAAEVYAALARRKFHASGETAKIVNSLVLKHTQDIARIIIAIDELSHMQNSITPLISALYDLCTRRLGNMFFLCSLLYDSEDIHGVRRKILEGTPKERALGMEWLEVLLDKNIKHSVLCVVEHFRSEQTNAGELSEFFHVNHINPAERIEEIRTSHVLWPEDWLHTCADHAAWILGYCSEAPEECMLHIIERVLTLKSAEIFSAIPDGVLAHIASIAEEIDFHAGETFITKGELGECMYIIRSGKVLIHDGPKKIAALSSGMVVGEMALLDPEPRSASATAMQETRVLKIEKESFDTVMADHPGIARGVITMLCRRLRACLT